MIAGRAVGICPVCNESVKGNDSSSWICPCDLSESNPYHQVSEYHALVVQVQDAHENYSNCPSIHGFDGGDCEWNHLPMHEACADGGDY